jgi:hypothetical protein
MTTPSAKHLFFLILQAIITLRSVLVESRGMGYAFPKSQTFD